MKKLCHIDDIPLPSAEQHFNSAGFKVGEHSLFAVRDSHNLTVYHNSCPHLGLELNWQPDRFLNFDGDLIHCATHGALFQPEDGLCISGPCSGQSLIEIPHRVENGEVLIDLA